MDSDDDRTIVVRGEARTIAYAVCANGEMPAKEFLEGLDAQDQRKRRVLFERLAGIGTISNREQFKKVEGEIWEFKRGQIRIACFQHGRTWRLTHGFMKKADRWPNREIERAARI